MVSGLTKAEKQQRNTRRKENPFDGRYSEYTTATGVKRCRVLHPTKGWRDRSLNAIVSKPEENGFWKMLSGFFRKKA